MIRVNTTYHGIVELDTNPQGIALLRQLAHHSPNLKVEVSKRGHEWVGSGYRVPLHQLDLTHEGITVHNVDNEVKNDNGKAGETCE